MKTELCHLGLCLLYTTRFLGNTPLLLPPFNTLFQLSSLLSRSLVLFLLPQRKICIIDSSSLSLSIHSSTSNQSTVVLCVCVFCLFFCLFFPIGLEKTWYIHEAAINNKEKGILFTGSVDLCLLTWKAMVSSPLQIQGC